MVLNGDSAEQRIENVVFQGITYEVNEWYCPPIPQACDGQGADYMNTSAIFIMYVLCDIFFLWISLIIP